MALPNDVLRLFAKMHRKLPFAGPILTLGVQDLFTNYDQALEILSHAGLEALHIPTDKRLPVRSLYLQRQELADRGYIHPSTYFSMLGIQGYSDLDATPQEGALLVHDLNQPVPENWHGKFGTVLDGGTLEHVFDLKAALFNIVRLVRVGGDVVHLSPVANWINHGFIQPCPVLYYDFYQVNGFEVVDACLLKCHYLKCFLHVDAVYPYEHDVHTIAACSSDPHLFLFRARRLEQLPKLYTPGQSKYADRLPGPHFGMAGKAQRSSTASQPMVARSQSAAA